MREERRSSDRHRPRSGRNSHRHSPHVQTASPGLTACGKTHTAFDRRSIPAEPRRFAPLIVAFRSKYTRYSSLTRLVSRTPTGRTGPRRSRRSCGFHHRLLRHRNRGLNRGPEATATIQSVPRPSSGSRGNAELAATRQTVDVDALSEPKDRQRTLFRCPHDRGGKV